MAWALLLVVLLLAQSVSTRQRTIASSFRPEVDLAVLAAELQLAPEKAAAFLPRELDLAPTVRDLQRREAARREVMGALR